MRYVSIPVTVDAWRAGVDAPEPEWVVAARELDSCQTGALFTLHGHLLLRKLYGGASNICPGDWLVRDAAGNLSAHKGEVFGALYEPLDEPRPRERLTVRDCPDCDGAGRTGSEGGWRVPCQGCDGTGHETGEVK